MGCVNSSPSSPIAASVAVKTNTGSTASIYRDRTKRENYILRNKKGEASKRFSFVKNDGDIAGEQFVVEECENSNIFLMDNIECVTIDLCSQISLLTGPIEGSIFIRDCSNCDFFIICQQFRMRNCKACRVFLLCTSSPIIESSSDIEFGCHHIFYKQLQEQIQRSSINPWNNKWYDIHDFTPNKLSTNYSLKSSSSGSGSDSTNGGGGGGGGENDNSVVNNTDVVVVVAPAEMSYSSTFYSSIPEISSFLNSEISPKDFSLKNSEGDKGDKIVVPTHPYTTGLIYLLTTCVMLYYSKSILPQNCHHHHRVNSFNK